MKILLALLSLGITHAAPLTIAWDHDGGPVIYELYRGIELLGTTAEKTLVAEVAAGDVLHVLAVDISGQRSLPSEPLTILPEHIPPAAPTGLRVVVIETSSNLTDWQPVAYVPLVDPNQTALFVRTAISTIQP